MGGVYENHQLGIGSTCLDTAAEKATAQGVEVVSPAGGENRHVCKAINVKQHHLPHACKAINVQQLV